MQDLDFISTYTYLILMANTDKIAKSLILSCFKQTL